jgi:hypothetical protein
VKSFIFIFSFLLLLFSRGILYAGMAIIDGPANIRKQPQGNVILSLHNDVPVYFYDLENNWYLIRFEIAFDKSSLTEKGELKKGIVIYDIKGNEIGKTLDVIRVLDSRFSEDGKSITTIRAYTYKNNLQKASIKPRNSSVSNISIDSLRKSLNDQNYEIRAKAIYKLIKLKKERKIHDDNKKFLGIIFNIGNEILAKDTWDDEVLGYSAHRALNTLVSAIWKLDSVKALPLLKRISEHPEASFLEGSTKRTLINMQIKHCIEPEHKRIRKVKPMAAYINDESSKIGYLKAGFVSTLKRFLESIKIRAREMRINEVSALLADEINILIVPGASFAGGYYNEGYAKLKSYVKNGGNILVFSQQKGSSYSNLMNGVEALGYDEDRTCNRLDVQITKNIEAFAGLSKKPFVMATDGHFIKYPETVAVLLKRTETGDPVLISYPYGKGTIMASTSFTPLDSERGGGTEEEIIFFRELINYFSLPMELPKVMAGQTTNIRIKVTNRDANKVASKAVLMVYDPEKSFERYREKFPLSLEPGESAYVEFSYKTCPTALGGIWHTRYELLTEEYQLLTSEVNPEGSYWWDEFLLQPARFVLDGRFIILRSAEIL